MSRGLEEFDLDKIYKSLKLSKKHAVKAYISRKLFSKSMVSIEL